MKNLEALFDAVIVKPKETEETLLMEVNYCPRFRKRYK